MNKEEIENILIEFPTISEFEAEVIFLRRDLYSYTAIQRCLGNPSKKLIRQILLK